MESISHNSYTEQVICLCYQSLSKIHDSFSLFSPDYKDCVSVNFLIAYSVQIFVLGCVGAGEGV